MTSTTIQEASATSFNLLLYSIAVRTILLSPSQITTSQKIKQTITSASLFKRT